MESVIKVEKPLDQKVLEVSHVEQEVDQGGLPHRAEGGNRVEGEGGRAGSMLSSAEKTGLR